MTVSEGSEVTEDELRSWAARRIPERAAAPKLVEIIDAIPLTTIGKPFKPELRRRATEHAARRALPARAEVHATLDGGAVSVMVAGVPEDLARASLSPYAFAWRVIA